jgi:hypothetical protein
MCFLTLRHCTYITRSSIPFTLLKHSTKYEELESSSRLNAKERKHYKFGSGMSWKRQISKGRKAYIPKELTHIDPK